MEIPEKIKKVYSEIQSPRFRVPIEKVSKSFSTLLSCMIKIFMDSSNLKFVIDSMLRVSSLTNFIIGLVHLTLHTPSSSKSEGMTVLALCRFVLERPRYLWTYCQRQTFITPEHLGSSGHGQTQRIDRNLMKGLQCQSITVSVLNECLIQGARPYWNQRWSRSAPNANGLDPAGQRGGVYPKHQWTKSKRAWRQRFIHIHIQRHIRRNVGMLPNYVISH